MAEKQKAAVEELKAQYDQVRREAMANMRDVHNIEKYVDYLSISICSRLQNLLVI
jgi:hypothetical protein